MTSNDAGPPPWASRLGYAGMIPFVGLAAALWWALPGDWHLASMALLGYGATVTSFLGAIHWGLMMRDGHAQPRLPWAWGVVPSLLGWVALLLNPVPGLVLMAALLWACFLVDRILYPRYQLQAWLPMRLWLTLAASISCMSAAVALLR